MKYIKYVLILLVITTLILIIIPKRKNQLKIVTIDHNYSQNIIDNETIRFPLLINRNDSFVTIKDLVSNLTIGNDQKTVPLYLEGIFKQDYIVNYKDEDYYAYMIDTKLNQENVDIFIENAKLNIKYDNKKEIKIDVGNIDLISGEVNDFTFTYIDSKSSYLQNYYTVSKVLFGIKPKEDIIIKDVKVRSNDYFIDESNIEFVEDFNNVKTDNEIELEVINNTKQEYILQKDKNYNMVIPISYVNKELLFRFYIEIETNNGKQIVDDLLFLNQGYFPNFLLEDAKETLIYD